MSTDSKPSFAAFRQSGQSARRDAAARLIYACAELVKANAKRSKFDVEDGLVFNVGSVETAIEAWLEAWHPADGR